MRSSCQAQECGAVERLWTFEPPQARLRHDRRQSDALRQLLFQDFHFTYGSVIFLV